MNPALPEQITSTEILCKVDFWFDWNDAVKANFKVLMEMRVPTMRVVKVDPLTGSVPRETEFAMKHYIRAELTRPIQFVYEEEGNVKLIQHDPKEKTWSLNIKKGVINMMHVDLFSAQQLDTLIFNKTEKSIHGTCMTTYTLDTPLKMITDKKVISVRKAIDVASCANTYRTTFTNLIPETFKEERRPVMPLKALTTMEFNLTKTTTGFKLLTVAAFGEVLFNPVGDEKHGIASITNQKLTLTGEESYNEKMGSKYLSKWLNDILIMKIDEEALKTPYKLQEVTAMLKSYIADRMMNRESVPEDMTVKTLELVKLLRMLTVNDLTTLWRTFVDTENVDTSSRVWEEKEWFVRILSLVNNESAMKVVLAQLRLKRTSISKQLYREYISMLGFTPYVTEETLKRMNEFCSLRMVLEDTELTKTCLMTNVNLMNSFCKKVPSCNVKTPQILTEALYKISLWKEKPMLDMTEKDMLEYITFAETLETADMLQPLLDIIRNHRVPLRIRVGATLALRPLAPKLSSEKLALPMFMLFTDLDLPEDLRLAVVTVIMEYPVPTVLRALVQHLRVEPSANIKRFIFDRLLTITEEKMWPAKILEAVVIAKDQIIRLGLVPESHRWLRQSDTTIIPVFRGVDGAELVFKRNTHFTNKTIFPRTFLADVELRIMGRRMNLMKVDLRAEGLQEMMQRFSGLTMKQHDNKITEIFKRLTTVDAEDEDFRLFANLKFLGRQLSTFHAAAGSDSWKEMLSSNEMVQELLSYTGLRRDTGVDVRMPVEFIHYIPTCNGIPLAHELTSVLRTNMVVEAKAETTPAVTSWRMLFTSPKSAEISLGFYDNSHLLIRGTVFHSLPFLRCGTQFTTTEKIKLGGKIIVDVDLASMEYEAKFDFGKLPAEATMFKMETKSESFVWLMEETTDKPRFINQTILPEHIFDRLYFLTTEARPIESRTTALLRFGPKKFLNTRVDSLAVSETPEEWHLIRHGESGRIVTVCNLKTKRRCLQIHPQTKKLVLTERKPTFWVRSMNDADELTLSTLVEQNVTETRPIIEKRLFSSFYDIVKFAAVFQEEGIEIEEMQTLHKMFNEGGCRLDIVNITLFNNEVVLSEAWRYMSEEIKGMPMRIQIKENPREEFERRLLETPLCTSENKEYAFCVTGFAPLFSRRSSMLKMMFSPSMVKVFLPMEEFTLQVFKVHLSKDKTTTAEDIETYKLKVHFVGTSSEPMVTLTLKRYIVDNRISMTVRKMSELTPDFNIMCLNAGYMKDSLFMDISMEPKCEVKHFEMKVVGSPIFPRHWLRVDWLLTRERLPEAFYRSSLYLQNLLYFAEPTMTDVLFRTLFGGAVKTESMPTLLTTRDFQTLNGTITLRLLKETLAKLTIDLPMFRIIHKLTLPYKVYTFPRGTTEIPLARKLFSSLGRRCFHGRDFFHTFDGVQFKYDAVSRKCEQVLLQSCSPLLPRMLVTVRTADEWRKIVRIVVDEKEIRLTPTTYDAAPTITINDKLFTLTNHRLNGKWPFEIVFEPELNTLTFYSHNTKLHITVIGGKSVSIANGHYLSPFLFGKTCGLCGDSNADERMERVTPERVPVSNDFLFGLSWILPGTSCRDTCPLMMTKNKVRESSWENCRPLINLPACRDGCRERSTKKMELKNIPVLCEKTPRKTMDIKVPTDCKCGC